MPSKLRFLMGLLALAMLFSHAPPQTAAAKEPAIAGVEAVHCPVLTLKYWAESTSQEQYAFLFGFVTALEMERDWQGNKPLPLNKSTVSSWAKGLAGVTLREMHQTIQDYIAANPKDSGRNVVEVLGRAYISPKLTPAMRKEAQAHLDEIQKRK